MIGRQNTFNDCPFTYTFDKNAAKKRKLCLQACSKDGFIFFSVYPKWPAAYLCKTLAIRV